MITKKKASPRVTMVEQLAALNLGNARTGHQACCKGSFISYSSITHEHANCSFIYIAMLLCFVTQVLFISKTAKSWPVKLRKTWALSSRMCGRLVVAIFFVFASPAGAQRCPDGATGCSGPVSNWDTSDVTSMSEGKSKYLHRNRYFCL